MFGQFVGSLRSSFVAFGGMVFGVVRTILNDYMGKGQQQDHAPHSTMRGKSCISGRRIIVDVSLFRDHSQDANTLNWRRISGVVVGKNGKHMSLCC